MIGIDLKRLGTNRISFYLALEEVLIKENKEAFFIWDIDEAIIVGKNQLIESEINMEYVNENNIPIYRRPSGGGAIYADCGCFMFTFITKLDSVEKTFKVCLNKIKDALNDIGIPCYLSSRNDLMIDGKKFSGNAIYKKDNMMVLHGTFLYDTNLDKLSNVLNVDVDKFTSKGIKSFKERVINVKPYTNMNKEELIDHLLMSCSNEIIEIGEDITDILISEKKYLDKGFIFSKNIAFTYQKKARFDSGNVSISVDVKNNLIFKVVFSGDYFEVEDVKLLEEKFIGKRFEKEVLKETIDNINPSDYIYLFKKEDLKELLEV